MEGYPADENQAAAYMNKIIEKEIMRAPGSTSGSTVALKRARWENRRYTFNKLLLLFSSQISHNNLMVFMAFSKVFPSLNL